MTEAHVSFNGQGVALYPPGAGYGPRTMHDFEFLWLIEGDAVWTVDDVSQEVPEGAVVLVRPGQRHQYRFPRRRARHGYVHFTCDLSGLDLPAPAAWPFARQPGADDVLPPLLRHLLRLLIERPVGWEGVAGSALRHALRVFISGASAQEPDSAGALPVPVERALASVARLWRGGVSSLPTLADLARAAGCTPETLIRLFRRSLDDTPMGALRRLRLDRAAALLARSDLAVQAVAADCGFPSPYHFSRVFRAEYGMPPGEFRRRATSGATISHVRLVRVRRLASRVWEAGR